MVGCLEIWHKESPDYNKILMAVVKSINFKYLFVFGVKHSY